jgi:signal transduction histidine kinase/CRP-like cAMP-binding protein
MSPLAGNASPSPKQNRLLAALPEADYARLSRSLELVPLPLGTAVYESGGHLGYVYFPTDCIVSLLYVTEEGPSAEIAVAGNEGLVGISLFMGGETTPSRAVVQNAGHAYRVTAAVIKREFDRGGALHALLLRYTQALITQMSQTAVCNRHHSMEQQLCRWLLLSLDRLSSPTLEMTEDLIADMLGVDRHGAADATAMLQADGVIRYSAGRITVLDRPALERRVCECYAVVKREVDRLLPAKEDQALRLAKFIVRHMDDILTEWDSFALTILPAAATMSPVSLRDHAKQILEAIAEDIQTHQTGQEQSDKSKGLARLLLDGETAAATHGALRHLSGFDLLQLGSEYRALRASVLRLWSLQASQEHNNLAFTDITRFNESVDQALAESIARYAAEVARSRDTFLAVLGHDLRSPLSALSTLVDYLLTPGVSEGKQLEAAVRIKRSATAMSAMVRDLLEYTRTQLGQGIPVAPQPSNLGQICETARDEIRAAHPDCVLHFEIAGDLNGHFDAARLHQVLSNLLNNAIQHGAAGSPVVLTALGENDAITVQVKNHGRSIPPDALQVIFNPLVRVDSPQPHPDARLSTSLGLGLFIAREIVLAHQGSINVTSSDESGTVFTVQLPRVS